MFTLIEWYDLYLFGSLASIIASRFFPNWGPTTTLLCTLAIFASCFIAKPFGRRLFGRRYTSWPMLLLMGTSTFVMGLVPGYEHIGFAAPLILLLLRLAQGLSLGTPRRDYFAALTPAAASLGLVLGLGVILIARYGLDPDRVVSMEKFNAWGWRIPFLVSGILLAAAAYIRTKSLPQNTTLPENTSLFPDPAFPTNPTFPRKPKASPLSLFAVTIAQGVIFYTGQIYIQSFLGNTCHIDFDQSKSTLLIATVLAMPFFLIFGRLNDRVGHRTMILSGILLAILTYFFLFPQLLAISGTRGRTELTDRKEIRSTIAFIGKSRDMARATLTYTHYADGMQVLETRQDTVFANGRTSVKPAITLSATLNTGDYWKIIAILFVIVLCVTIVGGPVPSNSIGNGIIGGLTPFIAVLLTAIYPGNDLAGLWFPIGMTAICFVANSIPHRKFAHVN
ncbi:MAG TPA: MFS transporter [Puia sp.]|jgi:MFS family permease|nr:MFS transporter [Puia sp.]